MDRFHHAVATALPLLENLRNGMTTAPSTTRPVLHRLKVTAHTLRTAAPAASPKTSAPADRKATSRPSTFDASEATSPTLIPTRAWTLHDLRAAAIHCTACAHLVGSRTQVVFGVGNPHADLMFIGEAPGADEDAEGEPFVGKSGQLLTKIIQTMNFTRDRVYLATVLKCRPDLPPGESGNRKPHPGEMATCFPWLAEQIRLVQPKVLVALGATATEGLLQEKRPMRELRGQWLDYEGIPTIVTHHPDYLLRNQSITEKRKVWEDMLAVLRKLNLPITEKQQKFFT
jgi:DNA polymerase